MRNLGRVTLVACVLLAPSVASAQEKKEQKEVKPWPVTLVRERDTTTIIDVKRIKGSKKDSSRVVVIKEHKGKTDTLEIIGPTWGPPYVNPPQATTMSLLGDQYDPGNHRRIAIPYYLHVRCPVSGKGDGEISWGIANSGEIGKATVSHDQQEAIKAAIDMFKLPPKK